MKCTHCNKDLNDDLKFCPYCGHIKETIVKVCIKCGNILDPDHQFCGKCGSEAIRTEIKNAVADIEGNVYNAVQIGKQVWMSQNMKVTIDRDGNELVLGKDYWYPNGDESLMEECGLLYTWDAAMRIAPQGWHLPSDTEWEVLMNYISRQSTFRCSDNVSRIAQSLASTFGWEFVWPWDNRPANNNTTGFSAIPAGGRYSNGYIHFGHSSLLWSATVCRFNSDYADARYLYFSNLAASIASESTNKTFGLSVRCLRD